MSLHVQEMAESPDYTYNGRQWIQALTVPDENSFFHAVFGSNDDEVYYDKHAKVRRLRWATCLTYFANETMPPRLAECLKKCLLAHDEYKHISLEDKDQLERYVSGILTTETPVTVDEIPILATLENVKVTVLLDKKGDSVVVVEPNFDLLGTYKTYLERRREVLVCLDEQTFSKLEPMDKDTALEPETETDVSLENFLRNLADEAKSKSSNSSSVAKLYDFLVRSCRVNFLEKGNQTKDSERKQELSVRFDQCLVYLQTLALQYIFEKEQCDLFLSFQEADEAVKEDVLTLGLVEKTGNRFHFANKALAEYFISGSLIKELELQNRNVDFQRFFVEVILSSPEYAATRAFLNHRLQTIMDSIPADVLQNYLSDPSEGNAKDSFKLIYLQTLEGSMEIIRLLLKCVDFKVVQDAEVNIADVPEPLRGNSLKVLQFLVQRGGLNIKDRSDKITPLHLAVQRGQLEVARLLVQQGAQVDIKDSKEATPLHLASRSSLPAVELLVELGANVNATDDNLRMPLHVAAEADKADIVRFLVGHGAKIDALGQDGFAPIHCAGLVGRWDTVKLLVELGANFATPGNSGSMLVNLYASRGQLDLVRYLTGLGADLNVLDDLGDSALTLAVSRRQLPTVECLVELGADVNHKRAAGQTPLHLAASYGYLEFVKFFVENGSLVDARGGADDITALHLAALKGHLDVVEYLVGLGADLEARSGKDHTPLSVAALGGRLDVVKFLVGRGAHVDIRADNGYSVLHLAAMSGHLDVVKHLVELGVDVDARSGDGQTGLHFAATLGHREVVEFLVDRGADAAIRNNEGRTALQEAEFSGRLDMANLLRELGCVW